MTIDSNTKQSRLSWLRTWKGPAAAAGVLLLLFAWWLIPSKIERVETVDGEHAWNAASAPARRLFVWAPAMPLDELSLEGGSLIRPQLADGGGTLYFTLRRPDGRADIVRSRFANGSWTTPQGAAEFNSSADDLGVVFNHAGREAYFYSNRPGGFGGFDLYVSRLDGDRWTAPQNLGGQINTPAQEYDPALSPDGLSLFFASNRTVEMQESALHRKEPVKPQAEVGDAEENPRDWSATLRAHPGQTTFDLYRTERPAVDAAWSSPSPIAELNRPDSNEGAPALAPGGVHLYFASDRPDGRGGFDLYRAKFKGGIAEEIENLGPSINTAADELEPGLSPEGFSLVFSSNRDAAGAAADDTSRFALYRSRAVEVTEETGWDESNWLAFAGVWWWAALLVLGAVLLVFLWIYSHHWVAETAVAFRFFLASLMFHLLLVLLLAFTMIREQVLQHREELAARDEFIEVLPEPSPEPGLSAFDKAADLASAQQAAAMQRQAASEPLAQPAEPPRPTISQELARNLPPELVVRIAPRPQAEPEENPPQELARRPLQMPPQTVPLDEALELKAEQMRAEAAANPATSDAARAAQTSPMRNTPDAPRPEVVARAAQPLPAAKSANVTPVDRPAVAALARRDPAEAIPTDALQLADEGPQLAAARIAAENPPIGAPAEEKTSTAPPEGTSPAAQAARTTDVPERAASAAVASRSPAERDFQPNSADVTRLPRSAAQAIVDATTAMPEGDAPLIAGPAAGDLIQLAMSDAGPLRSAAEDVAAISAADASDNDGPKLGESAVRPLAVGSAGAAAAPKMEDRLTLVRAASPEGLAQVAELGEAAPAALAGESLAGDPPLAGGTEAARNEESSPGVASATPVVAQAELNSRAADAALLLARRAVNMPDLEPAGGDPARAGDDFAVAEIEDRVSVRQMFALRSDERKPFIEEFGGTAESERAIELGLAWLAKQQKEDGHWALQDHQGNVQSDTAATGFALLPFLGQGKTHKKGEYQPTVERGLKWLVEHQKTDGDLFVPGSGNAQMYSHGVAAIALCEAFGMTGDPLLQAPAQKALDFIVAAQEKSGGGWRYHPGEPGDTSVVGWQVMALKSGEMAGLVVPQQTLDLAGKWLASVEAEGPGRGQFGYQGRGGSAAMTAEGLLCRQFLGIGRRDPSMKGGAEFLVTHLPQAGQESSYYWYYATQVMYHMQGDYWTKWNAALRDLVVKSQEQNGDNAGTWPPGNVWEQQGGRIYATSLRLLMLEVYYRHLPLYRQLGS